jgi:hypothetical protein
VIIPLPRRRLSGVAALAATLAALLGCAAAIHYQRLGLTLTHYDARGHLIVARRIIDSVTPGWQQIGAVWLPLPHLLNMLPVQIDVLYRTGWSAVALSVASFAIATAAIASIVGTLTGSRGAALAGAAVFALNPNLLYLQATPMTEPLLVALSTAAIAALVGGIAASARPLADPRTTVAARPIENPTAVGLLFALACLTRYEAWPVTAAALALTVWVLWRRGTAISGAARTAARMALYPALAIVGFLIFSRVVVGAWFVSGDFFVPENKALGDAIGAAREIGWGTAALSASVLVWVGVAGLSAAVIAAAFDGRRAHAILAVSLIAAAAVPFAAFYDGHPFRIRYLVPMIPVVAIGCGLAAGLVRRGRAAASLFVLAVAVATLQPFDPSAPMVLEAQWDRPNLPVRLQVTRCIGRLRPGAKIMASMGSLGHYMQETSTYGFRLRDFLHEGNGDIWLAAIQRPRPFADWVLIEEKAEGGDMLARIAREHPHFLDGYSRVCEGAGLALYRRD